MKTLRILGSAFFAAVAGGWLYVTVPLLEGYGPGVVVVSLLVLVGFVVQLVLVRRRQGAALGVGTPGEAADPYDTRGV